VESFLIAATKGRPAGSVLVALSRQSENDGMAAFICTPPALARGAASDQQRREIRRGEGRGIETPPAAAR
jgi:hypothetical protein